MRNPRPSRVGARLRGIVLVALCSTPLPAEGPAPPDANRDAAEIGAYRLSLPTLRGAEQALRSYARTVAADPSLREELERLRAAATGGSQLGLERAVAQVESMPGFKKALTASGLTPREFVLFGFALVAAAFAEAALPQGGALPPDTPPALGDNVKWLRENRAEVERLQVEIAELAAPLEEPKDEPSQKRDD